jgi:hypothetical protein
MLSGGVVCSAQQKEPPKKESEVKMKLADARVKILNSNKAGVKMLLGAPDDTRAGKFNGANTVVWIYKNQKVVWNDDTEKYYPVITVAFYDLVGGGDPGNAIQVDTK